MEHNRMASSSVPNIKKQRYSCELCPNSYRHKHHLKRHIAAVHENILHRCKVCGLSLSSSYNLTRHMNSKHPTTQTNTLLRQASILHKTVTAPTTTLLGQVDTTLFNTQPSPALNSPVGTLVPNLNQALTSSSCHNQATTAAIPPLIDQESVPALNQGSSSSLNDHASSSSTRVQGAASSSVQAEVPTMGKSQHTCQICQKTFAYLRSLRRHHKIKHSQQQHQCNICEEIFSYRFLLKNHIKQIHTLPKPVDPNAPSLQV
ncbi:hypothetical protein BsWGS_05351 [Bradybaena similaris]